MTGSSFDLVIKDKDDGQDINLPVSPEKLGGFISSLLGQAQTIERELYGTFDVNHEWLLHLHALVDQRIKQQNHASLTDFKAIIFYEDNLKRTLNSVEAFQHFSETKKITSQSVRITWTYLVSFPNKDIPEKQEIGVYLSSKAPAASKPEDPVRRIMSSKHKVGVISYRISHTERTWGDDIENLLKQEIDHVLEEEPNNSFLSVAFALLSLAFLFGGMLFPEWMNEYIQKAQVESIFHNYQEVIDSKPLTIQDLGEKVDLTLEALRPENGITKVGFGYRIISFAFGMAMAVWCIFLSEREKPSFVVLTKEAKQRREKLIAREKRSYFIWFFSFIVSVGAGVLGNYVYYIFTTT
ncbi:hypothetical protein [Marinobacter nauticus]|uniref:hypothetical protein n=1 Tax=Marinobacter nauticus TaxID=2743 RepID=UPI000EACEFB8|nr:hypothetical protein [Marinobacter nauticus]RKR71475.1 hypothetical protein C7436_3221 [Marinobacter nauticus]